MRDGPRAPGPGLRAPGYTHLRAGPSAEYPLVVTLPPNTLLDVNGCIDDFSWCDVDWQGNRGWVFGNYLFYDYQDRRVPILQFGAVLGIGVVAFSIGDYWGRYYTGRPWYRRESYWMHRPPPRHPPGFRATAAARATESRSGRRPSPASEQTIARSRWSWCRRPGCRPARSAGQTWCGWAGATAGLSRGVSSSERRQSRYAASSRSTTADSARSGRG